MMRIGIVNDMPMAVEMLRRAIALEPELSVAWVAGNGQEAVDVWRRQAWDVILMDVQMPVMDGPTATRQIRSEEAEMGRPHTPIIALTANAMAHQVADYKAAGMDDHLGKPINPTKLLETVARWSGRTHAA